MGRPRGGVLPVLTLTVDAGASLITLRIEGPPEADAILDELLPPAQR